MTTVTKHLDHGVRMWIDQDALTATLVAEFGSQLNQAADRAHQRARAALPTPGMKSSIRWKSYQDSPEEFWTTDSNALKGFLHGMRIPVALVVNNSLWAVTWEYGSLPVGKAARHGTHTSKWNMQYRPLGQAIQSASGGFRKVQVKKR